MPRLKPTPPPESGRIDNQADLGRIIRYMRMQAGLTADEAALSIGVAKATLLRAEQGQGALQFDTLLRIFDGLGLRLIALPATQGAESDIKWPRS